MNEILVVGSAALDTVQTPEGKARNALGGSAIHFSVSASFFTGVRLVAVVGRDFPQKHIDFLKERKINIKGLETVEGKTFRWEGKYTGDMNTAKTLKTCLNVFEKFHPKIPDDYRQSKYVFLANIDPELQMEVLRQVRRPVLVASDTMNLWISLKPAALRKMLKYVDILVINDAETKQFSGESNLLKAAGKLLKLGPGVIIVKRGEYGSMMFTARSIFSAPSYPLGSVVDPTGAGDTFAGGMMGYLAKTGSKSEANIRRAIIYGTVMASFNVQDFSVNRMRNLTGGEIKKRFSEVVKLTRINV